MTARRRNDYQLLDFGHGRRLERFGDFVLDRPAPGTEDQQPADAALWKQADARYQADRAASGEWSVSSPELAALSEEPSETWQIQTGVFSLGLRLAPSGQVGVFPEQADNWSWIAERVLQFRESMNRAPRVLNLFAYTGGSTLAAAAAGAEVAHVDASSSVVNWARENANISGLEHAPIRWLVEDARKFVQRELRRRRTYHGIVLDPPSYGHGGGKRVWKIEQDLEALVAECLELCGRELAFFLLSAHTPEFDARRLQAILREQLDGVLAARSSITACDLELHSAKGGKLAAGSCVQLATR